MLQGHRATSPSLCAYWQHESLQVQEYGICRVYVCLQERAKEVRQAKQLAEATSTKFPGYGSGHHSRDSVTPGNTLCFCAIK